MAKKIFLSLVVCVFGSLASADQGRISCVNADAVIPFRTEIFTTSKNCNQIITTNRGISVDRAVQVVSKVNCDGVSYAIVRLLPLEGYGYGDIVTVRTDSLIKGYR